MIASRMTKTVYVVFSLLLVLMTVAILKAQAPETQENEATSPAPTQSEYPDTVKITDAEPLTAFEVIDAQFGWLVGKLASTLFYEVAATERQYVQKNHVVYYYRDADSDGPFQIAELSKLRKPEELPDEASEEQLLAWVKRGKTTPSATRDYRLGVLGGIKPDGTKRQRQIEYTKYVIDKASKYIRVKDDDGTVTFRPLTPMRGLLDEDPETWLTRDQVEDLAKKGELALDPAENGADTPFLFTESVNGVPVVVIWLSGGALFFTCYFVFVNFWGFRHAISVVSGTYDDPNEPGEVTHFQALASALSATVGLGNIAGVTIAMTAGGPGAFFWMLMCGFLGMTSKFVECTLGVMYREVKPDGTILGGPMQYLINAFEQFGLKPVGIVLSIVFSVMCVMASFGGGNMFQANQAASQVRTMINEDSVLELSKVKSELVAAVEAQDAEAIGTLQKQVTAMEKQISNFDFQFNAMFGLILATFVALVIIGGIKRIGATASKIVPSMCLLYVAACVWIIATHITQVPALVLLIFTEAFNPTAIQGGILGVIVLGVQRAAFSNEAGVGSAAIAHSAAKTDEPVREGFVALLGPFIDTIVVCSMTALVILITGAWDNQEWIVDRGLEGVQLTSEAFKNEIDFFPYVLTISVVLFAFSTIVSWSYYGERCWERLFGARSLMIYKAIFVFAVFVGAMFDLGNVLTFSDIMILTMAFPNVLGALLLAPVVKRALGDYWRRYQANEFKKFK